ncbi:MAG: glycosyltransferase [Planctomycetota bacterium]
MADAIALLSLAALAYTYLGYALLLRVLARSGAGSARAEDLPDAATVILAAHNEAACTEQTLSALQRTQGCRLSVIVASDASTDGTDAIVRSFQESGVRLVRLQARGGKLAALQRAAADVTDEVIVCIDASSIVRADAIPRLLQHFEQSDVGSVTGARRVLRSDGAVASGDGLYWRYESMLRSLESRTGSSHTGVEGGLFAIRRSLLRLDFAADLADDLAIGFGVTEQGYRNLYDVGAAFDEPATSSVLIESARRVRVVVKGMRTVLAYRRLLNPLRQPGFCFQILSHKIAKWAAPFALLALFAATAVADHPMLQVLFWAQVGFYSLAAAGALWPARRTPRVLAVPLFFSAMHWSMFLAWFAIWRRYSSWSPPSREFGPSC